MAWPRALVGARPRSTSSLSARSFAAFGSRGPLSDMGWRSSNRTPSEAVRQRLETPGQQNARCSETDEDAEPEAARPELQRERQDEARAEADHPIADEADHHREMRILQSAQ